MSTYTVSVFSALSKEKLVQSEDVRWDATSRVQYLPRSAFDEGLVQGWIPGAMALKVSARENLVSAKQAPGEAQSLLSFTH